MEEKCFNCEYWDAGGDSYRMKAQIGDCLNSLSPMFNPQRDFGCAEFYPNTTVFPEQERIDFEIARARRRFPSITT